MFRRRIILCLFCFLTGSYNLYAGVIVVSIKPLYGLVAKVLKDTDHRLELLYDGLISPHITGLKISDVVKLRKAALIFWAGEIYERGLQKHIEKERRAINLSHAKGLNLLYNRAFDHDIRECHDGKSTECSHHACSDHHGHSPESLDGHYWLDINNAMAIIKTVRDRLSMEFPSEKDVFYRNADEALRTLEALKEDISKKIRPLKYMSFHDFTQYFDRTFKTQCVGVVTADPHSGTNAKHLSRMLSRVVKENISFVMREKQFKGDSLILFQAQGIPVKTMDYLGTDFEPDAFVYERILSDLASAFR